MQVDVDCGRHRLCRTEHEKRLLSAIAKSPGLLFAIEGRSAHSESWPCPNPCAFSVMQPVHTRKISQTLSRSSVHVNPDNNRNLRQPRAR
jgi:hypothetical protein